MNLKNIFLIYIAFTFLHATSGSISGTVRDASTQQPLIGANIIISGLDMGSATDLEGVFYIRNVPVGSYNLTVTMIGYKSISRANIHVVPQRSTVTNFILRPTVLEGDSITVTANYFEQARDAITSSRTVDIEEIRSDPVGSYDIMAMMQSLPSVISGADQTNEIIVRGGSPGENLFVMDHIEIPYPNHFPEQGKGGGPITMIDTDFIERVDFFAGSFPARYGDKLSSVMDVTLRDGSRERHLSELNFNMAGFGFNFEGPISEKGSYMFALKRSFLDFVIQQSGLLAIPKYWTGQGKLTHNFSPTRKLSLNVIGGIDAINIEGEDDPQLRGADNVEYNSNQLTLGLTYKDLFSIKGYSILSLSTSNLGMNTDVYKILENGDRSSYYNQDDSEWETTLKGDLVYRLAPEMEVSTGFNVKAIHLDYDNWVEVSPRKVYGYALQAGEPVHSISTEDYYANYFQNPDLIIETIAVYSELDTVVTESILGFWKTGIYSQLSLKPIPSIELNMGLRHESISYTKEGNFPPRLGFSFQFSPRMKFNLSAGRYYQSPFNIHLNTKRGQPEKLKNYFTDQGVLGLEYFLSADTRATLEVFSKEYEDIIGFEILSDASGRDSLNNNNLINSGKGSSRGLELYIQKKYSKNWYGSLAWSHSVAEGVDPRTEKYYPWNYDYRDVINLVGGYKIRYEEFDWYRRYKKTVWAKSLSWLPFMPSDEYEISFRFRYMGGRPYTPKTYDPNIREWVVNSDQSWNSERYDPYIRFDIMIQQRFNFRRMNMVAFWDILNVFNRDNPWEYVYLVDGSKKMAWQYKTFPVGGLILEF